MHLGQLSYFTHLFGDHFPYSSDASIASKRRLNPGLPWNTRKVSPLDCVAQRKQEPGRLAGVNERRSSPKTISKGQYHLLNKVIAAATHGHLGVYHWMIPLDTAGYHWIPLDARARVAYFPTVGEAYLEAKAVKLSIYIHIYIIYMYNFASVTLTGSWLPWSRACRRGRFWAFTEIEVVAKRPGQFHVAMKIQSSSPRSG